MDLRINPPRSPARAGQHAQAPSINTNGLSHRPSASANNSPFSSAPPTPNPNATMSHRSPHPATSPLHPSTPKVIRRTSSAMSLHDRTSSSPNPLRRKSSRVSLGGGAEDEEKRPTPKRSISNLISGLREAQTRMESIEEPVPLTAPQIASDHFARELLTHASSESEAETLVVLHDACYGHRYSRLRTTKTLLSMIVERPERIHASVLGASTAYVRLGGHHADARNAPHPDRREVASPPFKIRRTARTMDITSSHVTNVHGTAWMLELKGMCAVAGERVAAGAKELSRSDTPTDPEKRKLHEGDLYLCAESLNAFQGALGGVADAVDAVFSSSSSTKRAFVAVRPPGHHCSADFPSGFCWLNNVHVGIEYAAQTFGLTHAAILDFDLHHGDGSQAITWERNSKNNVKRLNAKPNSKLKLGPDIGYYSLHDINSYPCEMGDDEKVQAASLCIENAHGQSIWNVHLQPWKTEKEFWELYETRYRVLLDKARAFLESHTARFRAEGKVAPKAALFISAGFDASEWEGAGMQRHKVNVPTEFYARFTRDVVELAQEVGTGCEGRVISVLEGGYSDRALCSGVLSHLSGLCATPVEAVVKAEGSSGMDGLDQMMRGLGINGMVNGTTFQYSKAWWSLANLTALEMQVNPPPPPQAKKHRVGQHPTYATPTESFAYKVVNADKFARSISGTMREVQAPARPPTPPPPEVDWVTATQELLKLLIPADRQTKSCTAEELAGPKIKKEHVPAAAPADLAPRQLRDRKTKVPGYAQSTHSDETESVRSVSRSSRRQTIAELPSSSAAPPEPSHQRRASRRLSAGSAFSSTAGDLDTYSAPPIPAIPNSYTPPSTATAGMPPPPAPGKDALQAKKFRAPMKKEMTSSAPASPKRATKAPTRLSGPVVSNKPSAPTSAVTGSNEVDALTSGMRKVTLKVGTREEHDRKLKEKTDAERRARALKAAETRKANAAAKKAAAVLSGKENSAVAGAAKPVVEPSVKKEIPVLHSAGPVDVDMGEAVAVHGYAQPSNAGDRVNATYAIPTVESKALPATYPNPPATAEMGAAQPLPTTVQAFPAGIPARQQEPVVPSFSLYSQPVINALPSNDLVEPQQQQQHQIPIPPVVLQSQQQQQQPQQQPPMIEPAFPAPAPMQSALPKAARSPAGSKLPVWSSTGAIPFAAPTSTAGPTSAALTAAVPNGEGYADLTGDASLYPPSYNVPQRDVGQSLESYKPGVDDVEAGSQRTEEPQVEQVNGV